MIQLFKERQKQLCSHRPTEIAFSMHLIKVCLQSLHLDNLIVNDLTKNVG